MSFEPERLWPILAANGMLVECRYAMANGVQKSVWVGYTEPDREMLDGSQSKQYEIEYQAADMPLLKEDDELVVTVRGTPTRFIVRQAHWVPETGKSDGFFRNALLTRL